MARRQQQALRMNMNDSESEDEREEGMADAGDESDDEPVLAARARAGNPNPNRLPLHHFLRLIAGGRMMDHGAAASNEDLVASLRRSGVIQSDRVARALRLCARDLFVPAQHAEEALVDAPIRVDALDFNISAPHMHATCLEALKLEPGHRFLDVGSGCGVLTAAGAYLVGRGGLAVGFDIRRECIPMGREAVARLTAGNPEYAAAACPARFELQNCFMPAPRWLGQFDRIHVGASCPPDRLPPLLALLRPEGGSIVVPVSPSDLRVITRAPGGAVTQRVISQVRFSDLEVPTDAEILLATMRSERRQRTAPGELPSTYAQDVAAIVASSASGSRAGSLPLTPSGSYGEAAGLWMQAPRDSAGLSSPTAAGTRLPEGLPPTPQGGAGDRSWPHRLSKLFTACSSGSSAASEGAPSEGPGAASGQGTPRTPMRLSPDELGDPDLLLCGSGWAIPAHRMVLRQRCDHFRARCDGPFRDAAAERVTVPDQFSEGTVRAFLHYCYHDGMLEECGDPQEAVCLLHVSLYFCCPRLVHLCERRLADLLRRGSSAGGSAGKRGKAAAAPAEQDDEGLADAAVALLSLADDAGLGHLRAVALDYIVHHFEAVKATEAYAGLSKEHLALVAEEACAAHARTLAHIRRLAQQQPLPEPSY